MTRAAASGAHRARSHHGAWLVPALYASGALALGLVLPRVEGRFLGPVSWGVSASAAMAIYSSIASGMITLTGIVFSLAFVMVQFSATAYSPRLVLWISRDPLIAHAIGVFTATFVYALTALAWVDRAGGGNVPIVGAATVLLLLLASIAVFIGLIQRVALLQINRMLTFTGDRGREVIDSLYEPLAPGAAPAGPREAGAGRVIVHHGNPLAIQAVDVEALLALAKASDAVIEMLASVGDTVAESTPLARIVGGRTRVDEGAVLAAIQMGEERTFEQDPKYAIRLLVDIAIRALSPAVNDPTTAVQALDQIGDLLYRLGLRRLETGVFRDADGRVRLTVPFPRWDDFLQLALDEIRTCGAGSVQVMRRLKALISDLIVALPAERRDALERWQRRLQVTVAAHYTDRDDHADASVEDHQGLGAPRGVRSG
jgi:uncharacterized membrane protein